VTIDLGLTHVALPVTDIDLSIQFYSAYAQMQVIHRRIDKIRCTGDRQNV
jgi:catechol 2,3-dioxygenase-like lactoylglutathione lyase family enzyme